MDPRAQLPALTVSNLVPVWDEPIVAVDGGGSFAPAEAATVVAQALRVEPVAEPRLVTPPEQFHATDFVERTSAFAYDLLDERDDTWAERSGHASAVEVHESWVPVGVVHERRSAYEIAFILLMAAVAVLLAAPPLVQILLAARGIQA